MSIIPSIDCGDDINKANAELDSLVADSAFRCGRRNDMYAVDRNPEVLDTWRTNGTCSYCGSLSSDEFFKRIEGGEEVGPTDKNYKAYIGGSGKFYFQHFNEKDKLKFVDLYNLKKMKVGYPGYFYVKPFFTYLIAPLNVTPT